MTKPALDYLRASGVVPISIVGGLIQWPGTYGGAATYWTSRAVAKPIVRRAREIMGAADLTATAALHQAALELQQTLTLHDNAIERAALASQQLDLYMASMQGIGILKMFNAEFKRRRVAASASGERFINLRLR